MSNLTIWRFVGVERSRPPRGSPEGTWESKPPVVGQMMRLLNLIAQLYMERENFVQGRRKWENAKALTSSLKNSNIKI